MERMSPNIIFNKPELQGGKPIDRGKIVKIFADYVKIVSINKGTLRVNSTTLKSKSFKEYIINENDWSINLSRSIKEVRIRGFLRDQSLVYLYNQLTDQYICCASLIIRPYGDKASMSNSDINRIMGHASKVKAQKKILRDFKIENDEAIKKLEEDMEDFKLLETLYEKR